MATTDKYDRQLRLWGASGQAALGSTCIVLVRATAAGTETCKNLVLPGVGAILVLDDFDGRACTATDETQAQTSIACSNHQYASNFFLTHPTVSGAASASMGRAEMALTLLRELNPDVQGSWIQCESLMEFDFDTIWNGTAITGSGPLSSSLESFTTPSTPEQQWLVVASDMEPVVLQHIATVCEVARVPLVAVSTYGLQGMVRLQTAPTPLFNPKPRDSVPDLRLVQPFGALLDMARSIQWGGGALERPDHIPFPLILIHIAEQYKAAHDGALPSSFVEKQEFSRLIQAASRNYDNDLNFQEAVRNAYTAYSSRTLDLAHLASLRDAASLYETPLCHQLVRLLSALEQFLQGRSDAGTDDKTGNSPSQPPLHGSIPDMTASTDWYVRLQTIYQEQAAADRAEIKRILSQQNIADTTVVDDDMITIFCQNVHSLDMLQTGTTLLLPLDDDISVSDEICESMLGMLQELVDDGESERAEQLPLLWYLGYEACQRFHLLHGRYPGTAPPLTASDATMETDAETNDSANAEYDYMRDVAPLQSCLVSTVQKYKLQDHAIIQETILDPSLKMATEYTRYGQAEIHTIASIVGGVASQEAVKLITGQYVPMNNMYFYNGISSTAAVYKL